ncbi:MAG: hypothetical protein DRJ68_07080, partial [Thermoprotei archaeon]
MRVLMIGRGRSIALKDLEKYWGEVEVLDTTRSLKPPLKKFDLVVAQEPLRIIGLISYIHSKTFHEKLIYEVHSDYLPHLGAPDRFMAKFFMKRAYAIRAVNKTILLRLKDMGLTNILCIPSIYVRTEEFKPLKPPEERRPLALYVGRFVKQKNLTLLLSAFEHVLRSERIDAKLILVGRGEEEGKLRILVEKSPLLKKAVNMIRDWLPTRTLVDYYNSAAVFVSTSTHEGGPRTIFEACACETPFVSTRTGVVLDYAQHGREGFIVNWSIEEIAEHITRLLVDL